MSGTHLLDTLFLRQINCFQPFNVFLRSNPLKHGVPSSSAGPFPGREIFGRRSLHTQSLYTHMDASGRLLPFLPSGAFLLYCYIGKKIPCFKWNLLFHRETLYWVFVSYKVWVWLDVYTLSQDFIKTNIRIPRDMAERHWTQERGIDRHITASTMGGKVWRGDR